MPMSSMRLEYGKYLVELGQKYPDLVILEADLRESTQSIQFHDVYPKRYIQVGVAEQNMIGIAAGLALAGKIPIVHSFACFISMRACEQIRTSVAYPKLNVKFLAAHGGVSAGSAGTSHHAIEDMGIMRSIPNMVVLVPADSEEMRQALAAALSYTGPAYIRLSAQEVEDVIDKDYKFSIGKAAQLRGGDDVAIITTGIMLQEGLKAADLLLKKFGIRARVLQMASVKPIDRESIIQAACETGGIITIEEHNIIGGLGSAVCEVAAEVGRVKVKRLGIRDHFCGVGSTSYLLRQESLTADEIIRQVQLLLREEAIKR